MVTLTSDWCSKQLSELITLINSKIDPKSLNESCHCIELEHIESGTGKITGVQSSARVVSLKSRFTATDVLFGKLRPYLRKYAYPKFDGICSSEIWVFHPTEYITSSYLFYLIQSEWFINEANKTCGTKMPRAEWKALKDTVIKIPKSLSEQNAIASVLTNLDNLIESLEKLIAKKKLIKEGAMQDLLTGKKRLVGFDEEWKVESLDNLSIIITKQTGFDYSAVIKPALTKEKTAETYSFIQNKDFHGQYINFNTDYFIPQDIVKLFPKM